MSNYRKLCFPKVEQLQKTVKLFSVIILLRMNVRAKYLEDYSKIHNNHRNNFEITFIKYLNDLKVKQHFVYESVMSNKFRNLIKYMSIICPGSPQERFK